MARHSIVLETLRGSQEGHGCWNDCSESSGGSRFGRMSRKRNVFVAILFDGCGFGNRLLVGCRRDGEAIPRCFQTG